MKNNLEKLIVEYLKDKKQSSSIDIAERFLKFKSPNEKMAEIPVSGVMKGIEGVNKNENGFWYYDSLLVKKRKKLISCYNWYVVTLSLSNDNKVICVSVSILGHEKNCDVFWLKNPDETPEEMQVMLRSNSDKAFLSTADSVNNIYNYIRNGVLIVTSYKELGYLKKVLNYFSYYLPDESFLLSDFINITKIKKDSIEELYKQFYNEAIVTSSAKDKNIVFNLVLKSLFDKMDELEIKNIEDIIKFEKDKNLFAEWQNLKMKMSEIIDSPKNPGVYGFLGEDKKFLYIGKAKNLQKRLLSYFRLSDESPSKLKKLRENAYDLVINNCGSELESLLYEQRLILKHQPSLNRKIEINERKGEYKYIEDSVLLLPHHEKDKIVSIWIRKDQKIRMLSIDRTNFGDTIGKQLNSFFYEEQLKAEPTDFQELEIVNRWISQNRDNLNIIYSNRFVNGEDLRDQIYIEYESYINCMKEQ